MPNFVVAGRADCSFYTHAVQVAKFLSDNLPDLTISKLEFLDDAWNKYLLEINEANGWFVTKSPVIWKEVAFAGSKPHLIGGLSELWEYIDDYYGVHTFLDRKIVEELRLHNLKTFHEKNTLDINRESNAVIIGIYGFNNHLAQMILPELFSVPGLFSEDFAIIKIYDPESLGDIYVEEEIKETLMDYQTDLAVDVNFQCIFSTDLTDFVTETDLILITEDFCQRDLEEQSDWLKRCDFQIFYLAYEIFDGGKKNLKMICCHLGPVCFTATSLAKHCHNKRDKDIVAITAHEGLKALNLVSRDTRIPITNLGAPPVWGFVGLNQFIDVQGIVVLQEIIRPYRRSLKNIVGSTLPQKKIRKKLRLLSCTVDRNILENKFNERCNLYKNLDRKATLPLLRATLNVLELWYTPKKTSDQVISLGIMSTGAFGIPQKIVFSQSVMLDNEMHWVPYENLPILENSRLEIEKCIEFTERLMDD